MISEHITFLMDAKLVAMTTQPDALQHTGLASCETEMHVCDMADVGGFCLDCLEAASHKNSKHTKTEVIRQCLMMTGDGINYQKTEGKTLQSLTRILDILFLNIAHS